MILTKFGVSWLLGLGEEAKNRFSRWLPWRNLGFPIGTIFAFFLSISHPNDSYQVWSQLAFGFVRRSKKQIFKMAAMADILDIRSA